MPFGKAHTLHVEFAEKYDRLATATASEKTSAMKDPKFAAYARMRNAQEVAQAAQNAFAAAAADEITAARKAEAAAKAKNKAIL